MHQFKPLVPFLTSQVLLDYTCSAFWWTCSYGNSFWSAKLFNKTHFERYTALSLKCSFPLDSLLQRPCTHYPNVDRQENDRQSFFFFLLGYTAGLVFWMSSQTHWQCWHAAVSIHVLFLGLWKGGAERKKEKEGGLLVVMLFSANALVAYFIFAFPWDGCKHFFSVYCYSLNLAEGGG